MAMKIVGKMKSYPAS